ncbi:CAAX geranylgeranyltransferase alpha subunit [Cryptotrichosporon argae]
MAVTSYIPLGERSVWGGVTPVPQDDGPNALVPIMYSQEYSDALDYFRAVSAAGEKSDRVLELTETIVRLNPAHYTVWQYRLATLLELKWSLEQELELMNEFARENLKSYQVWHHRLSLMTHLSPASPASEIAFIHHSLLDDTKNYHTWAYLHWIYCHFAELGRVSDADWDDEETWCDGMLREDGRNNSAWGWRWFLKTARPGVTPDADGEIRYTLAAIHKIPHNVSAWNYLRGILKHFSLPRYPLVPSILPYTAAPELAVEVLTSAAYPVPTVSPADADTPLPVALALEFLAEAREEEGRAADALEIYGLLQTKYDRMRAAYWEVRRREVATA